MVIPVRVFKFFHKHPRSSNGQMSYKYPALSFREKTREEHAGFIVRL